MSEEESFLAKTGLQFFGRMSASVTHEIKNVLAIINENAGLLEDIVLMAEKGLDVSPERLQRLARTVGAQVGRADAVVKMMNHFSHSIDHFVEPVDLTQVATDVCDLCDRLLQMRGVTLETIAPPAPVVVTASRFYLQNLLWCCLDWATSTRSEKRTISLTPEKMDNGASAEEIQTEVYEVGKRHGFENLRDWFKACYEILLGQEQGPRMGSFIALYGVEESANLITRALVGEGLAGEDLS